MYSWLWFALTVPPMDVCTAGPDLVRPDGPGFRTNFLWIKRLSSYEWDNTIGRDSRIRRGWIIVKILAYSINQVPIKDPRDDFAWIGHRTQNFRNRFSGPKLYFDILGMKPEMLMTGFWFQNYFLIFRLWNPKLSKKGFGSNTLFWYPGYETRICFDRISGTKLYFNILGMKPDQSKFWFWCQNCIFIHWA